MKKTILSLAAITLAIMPSAEATTVGFAGAPTSRSVVKQDGTTAVAAGSLVLVGYFANESFALGAGSIAANVTAIQNAGGWTQFAVGQAPTATPLGISTVGAAGNKVAGSLTDNTSTADFFNGKTVYLWVFDAATIGAATQMGIYKATSATTPWVFPTNGSIPDSVTFSTAVSASTLVAVNSVGSAGSTLSLVAPVPEPSVAVLTVLGGIAMAARRRRNRA